MPRAVSRGTLIASTPTDVASSNRAFKTVVDKVLTRAGRLQRDPSRRDERLLSSAFLRPASIAFERVRTSTCVTKQADLNEGRQPP